MKPLKLDLKRAELVQVYSTRKEMRTASKGSARGD